MTPIFLSQNWIIFFPSKQIDFASGNQGGGVEFPANVDGVIAVGAKY